MLSLAWPWTLLLLIPLPWLVYGIMRPARISRNTLRVPFFDELAPAASDSSLSSRTGSWIWLSFIWCCLVLAAARPQWTGDPDQVPVSGRDLMLAVDVSGSMKARDMDIEGTTANRLEAVKHVAFDFISRRQGDRIGLILFGTNAYLQTPLSLDLETVNALLQESAIGIAGEKTAIGDAIGLAVKKLRDTNPAHENTVLILLTDGTNTAGSIGPIKASELAQVAGLKIYTIGMGAGSMAINTGFGQRYVNPSSELDERMLKSIAERTGGQYFRATDTDSLEKIYELIDQFEPISKDSLYLRPVEELFLWPLLLAMAGASCMALLHAGIIATRRNTLPETLERGQA